MAGRAFPSSSYDERKEGESKKEKGGGVGREPDESEGRGRMKGRASVLFFAL